MKKIAALLAVSVALPAGSAFAQFGPDYYGRMPVEEYREYYDANGNRVIVDSYGDVVDILPPAGVAPTQPPTQQWGSAQPQPLPPQPQPRDYGVRRDGFGNEVILEAPVERDGRYGGYEQVYPQPEYRDYREYPPAPGYGYDQRSYGSIPDGGPRPYTPPASATLPPAPPVGSSKATAEVAALQIYLDRAGISPGVIDGLMGSNVRKALDAYERKTGETIDPQDIDSLMARLAADGGLPITQYTISAEDVSGPFIAAVPTDYAEKAALPAMSYTSVSEKLAEKFHMDEGYLRSINPNADFNRPGTVIKVANLGGNLRGTVSRIVADKAKKQVFAYDESGSLIAAYPATIGSQSTPSPSGTHTVERIAIDPEYTYNPKINFKQGDNDQVLRIPPGPNGPVGTVWIALSKPTYGIHGTPEPSAIGKTESNGCIRLTNWDAQELAKLVKPGVTVEFIEGSGAPLVAGNGAAPVANTMVTTETGSGLGSGGQASTAPQFPPARPPAIEGAAAPAPAAN